MRGRADSSATSFLALVASEGPALTVVKKSPDRKLFAAHCARHTG